MLYQEIYDDAVQLVNEDSEQNDPTDYNRRAGYILATFSSLAAPVDVVYREIHAEAPLLTKSFSYVDLDRVFPLSDVFIPAATYYLAAMLVLDENERLSDKLFELYADEMATIQSSFPAKNGKTLDRYGLLK